MNFTPPTQPKKFTDKFKKHISVTLSTFMVLSTFSINLYADKMNETALEENSSVNAKTCIGEFCVGDIVYPHGGFDNTDPMVLTEFITPISKSINFIEVSYKQINPKSFYKDGKDLLVNLHRDAGPDACLEFETDKNIKACVGDTIVVNPLYDSYVPKSKKSKMLEHQAKTKSNLTYAKILKVLKQNGLSPNRAIVETNVPGLGNVMISQGEIGFTTPGLCLANHPDICIGSEYTTFFNEPVKILAYMPSSIVDYSSRQAVITTKIKGLNDMNTFQVKKYFKQIIDPNMKIQNETLKGSEMIEVAFLESNKVSMERINKNLISQATRHCEYKFYKRMVLDTSKQLTPHLSCKKEKDYFIYAGHGMVVGIRPIPKLFLKCNYEFELTCVDKDLKSYEK